MLRRAHLHADGVAWHNSAAVNPELRLCAHSVDHRYDSEYGDSLLSGLANTDYRDANSIWDVLEILLM